MSSHLKSVVLLLTLGVISVLAVLAQESPTPTITPDYGAEVTLTATPTPGWSGPGFLNMDWRGMVAQPTPTPGVTGAPDETLSGDRRYYRTNEIIATLVATHEW